MSHLRIVKDGDGGGDAPDVTEILERLVQKHSETPLKSIVVLTDEEDGSFMSWSMMTLAELHLKLVLSADHVLSEVTGG